jgi:hypothetical protein
MLTVTAISAANQWLGNDDQAAALKVLVAGGVATAALAGIEQIPGAQEIAVGIAWIAFVTLVFTRLNGKPSPVDNLNKLTGL